MNESRKNITASVHARLRTGALARGDDFNLTLQRYVAERFLYRLGASSHRDRFILKGAMVFALWGGALYRSTRDLDLTGFTRDEAQSLLSIVQEICDVPCPEDGLTFPTQAIRVEPIRDKSEYHGFRVKLHALLGPARLPLQVDVGFGDAIEPRPRYEEYPVLLDGPVPRIRAYSRETVVAEKLHAMVTLGSLNTRFKDFYDVRALAMQFSFSGEAIGRAIGTTFARRGTPFTSRRPLALTADLYTYPAQVEGWRGYLRRSSLPAAPVDFGQVGETLQIFLGSLWDALAAGDAFTDQWPSGGPWATAGGGEV